MCYKNPCDLTLGVLLHYLGKCFKYSSHMLFSTMLSWTAEGIGQSESVLCICTELGLEPSFDVAVVNVTVVVGQTAVLPCSIEYLGNFKVGTIPKYFVVID